MSQIRSSIAPVIKVTEAPRSVVIVSPERDEDITNMRHNPVVRSIKLLYTFHSWSIFEASETVSTLFLRQSFYPRVTLMHLGGYI